MTISPQSTSPVLVNSSWRDTVRADLEKVTAKIRQVSFLDNHLLDAAINMIVEAGGKRMRPALALLVGRATNATLDKMLSVAASIELLHTATLVHDDLVDEAAERRGTPTLHTKLPLGVTVLTGDFLFAQAAALAAEADNVRVVQIFAQTLVSICKGELLQAQTRWQVSDRSEYEQRIYGKTAALFEAAALSAAILGEDNEDIVQAYGLFGREVGMAFQIIDDALDFVADTEKLGKPAGHDLRQGYVTLPAMIYVQKNKLDHTPFIQQIEDKTQVENVIAAIRESGAPSAALKIAHEYVTRAEAAIQRLEWVSAMEPLLDLAQYVINRDF